MLKGTKNKHKEDNTLKELKTLKESKEAKSATLSGSNIILRKKHIQSDVTIPKEDLPKIVWDYTYCLRSAESIAKEYNVPSQTIHKIIRAFQADINNLSESYALIETQGIATPYTKYDPLQKAARRVIHSEAINAPFLSLLSSEDDAVLSDAEHTYAWIFTHTNNNNKALIESGLDVGILRPKGEYRANSSYVNALKIRGYYLRHKGNIKQFILELREKNLSSLQLDKGFIQSTLVTEIEQMQDEGDPKNKGYMLRALELLGKTIPGAFSDTIRVEEVSPDKALDRLIEMAKADIKKVSSLPKGSKVDYEEQQYVTYSEDD